MKKILVVLTGGTIGSTVSDKIIDTNDTSAYKIINLYNENCCNKCDFDVIQPFSELSENFTADTINRFIEVMKNTDFEKYNGVIITHGSDTVAYTSAFLSYLFSDVSCPIVLVAADYPPDDERSNALKNFSGAVSFIKGNYVKCGVFFAYGNPCEDVLIYLGTRINEADLYSDRFTPYGNEAYGFIDKNGCFIKNDKLNISDDLKSSYHIECESVNSNTLILKSFTGMNYNLIDVSDSSLKAVINIMYHSGTACTVGNDESFLKFVEKCSKNNVDVYCISFKNREELYSSASLIIDSGAKPLVNISYVAAYAKAVIAYSIGNKEIMDKNIFYESIE